MAADPGARRVVVVAHEDDEDRVARGGRAVEQQFDGALAPAAARRVADAAPVRGRLEPRAEPRRRRRRARRRERGVAELGDLLAAVDDGDAEAVARRRREARDAAAAAGAAVDDVPGARVGLGRGAAAEELEDDGRARDGLRALEDDFGVAARGVGAADGLLLSLIHI